MEDPRGIMTCLYIHPLTGTGVTFQYSIVLWQAEGLFNEAFPSKHIKTLPLCLHPMMMNNKHDHYHWKFVIIRISLAETTTLPRGYANEALKTKCALLYVPISSHYNTHTHTHTHTHKLINARCLRERPTVVLSAMELHTHV